MKAITRTAPRIHACRLLLKAPAAREGEN